MSERTAATGAGERVAPVTERPQPGGESEAVPAAAKFSPLGGKPGSTGQGNIDMLLDVPLEVTVELGRTVRLIKDILALGPGAVVELDKLAGETVDVLINGKLIARGEVVVIDENFGVRITDIVSPAERLNRLR